MNVQNCKFHIWKIRSGPDWNLETNWAISARGSQQISVVSEHWLEKNHDFGWNDVKILDYEPNWKKK